MAALDLSTLPPELHAALERVWPGCPEAQRRAVLGPWATGVWRTVWPDFLWPWQPSRRWWRPRAARQWRESFEAYFGARRSNLLEARGPLLFDPAQPFFETPWTQAGTLLRSPVPEVFSDGEFWAIAMQLFDGDVPRAEAQARDWAREPAASRAAAGGSRRDNWWIDKLRVMHAEATGTFS